METPFCHKAIPKRWLIKARAFLKMFIGDVVLAYSPIELNKRICKRLIAEEGDIVQVPMDGSALQGTTLIVSLNFNLYRFIVLFQIPDGHVWLEGDCPKVSRDCRDYGPIPKALLHGRPWFQVWPLERFGWIKNNKTNDY